MVEAVGLVMVMERDQELVDLMSAQLGRFITAKEPNTRHRGKRAARRALSRAACADTWDWRT
jgi:hypothetical protein